MVRSGSDPPLRKNVADLRSAFSKMILFFRIIFRAQPDPKNHATLCGAWDSSQNCTFHEKVRFSFKTVFAVLNRK